MEELGLRARKKAETRARIADVAARLFAVHGYRNVTIGDVAREAVVAEKTIYNYFPSKVHLVLDRDARELARLLAMLDERPAGTSPAPVVGDYVLGIVDGFAEVPPDRIRGTLSYLCATNPEVRVICLEMIDRHAAAVCEALLRELPRPADEITRIRVRAYAVRLCWVTMAIIEDSGRRLVRGNSPQSVANQLRLVVAGLVEDLEPPVVLFGPR